MKRFFCVLALYLLPSVHALFADELLNLIRDEDAISFINHFKEREIFYDFYEGEDKASAVKQGTAKISIKVDSKNNSFIYRMELTAVDPSSGDSRSSSRVTVHSTIPPFEFKTGTDTSVYRDKNKKIMGSTSVRVDLQGNTLIRTKTDTEIGKESVFDRKEFKGDYASLNLKNSLALNLLARKKIKADTKITRNFINDENILTDDDSKIPDVFKKEESVVHIDASNDKETTITEFYKDEDGSISKSTETLNSEGVTVFTLFSEVPTYNFIQLSNSNKKENVSVKEAKVLEIPECQDNSTFLDQIKNGKVHLRIKDNSKVPPAGPDQLIVGNEIILKKGIGHDSMLNYPVLPTDLEYSGDKEIPDDLVAEVKNKIGNSKKPIEVIRAIQEAVHKRLKYQRANDNLTLTDVFHLKRGDCNNFSSIYAGILRRLGFPAHTVSGVSFGQTTNFHSWLEVKFDEGWVSVEATEVSGDNFFISQLVEDSAYLKLTTLPSNSSVKNQIEKFKNVKGYFLELIEKPSVDSSKKH